MKQSAWYTSRLYAQRRTAKTAAELEPLSRLVYAPEKARG